MAVLEIVLFTMFNCSMLIIPIILVMKVLTMM